MTPQNRIQVMVSGRSNDGGKGGAVRHSIVPKSEETGKCTEDGEKGCDAIRKDEVPAIVFVDVLGPEVKHVNSRCVLRTALDC